MAPVPGQHLDPAGILPGSCRDVPGALLDPGSWILRDVPGQHLDLGSCGMCQECSWILPGSCRDAPGEHLDLAMKCQEHSWILDPGSCLLEKMLPIFPKLKKGFAQLEAKLHSGLYFI
ncbi:hypothetical protein DUI87_28018 [Hirundo rustica rustica]|uniref:Uncharacterized protein n=1 Tax=Hirundo rustica rustica TaxID=333673 RepID=A0A3M0J4Q9_HIRRU|nr:hypothetical protein DUI87_28018 [Hirundo rustica rustica]